MRVLTKSRFKLGLECPNKLFYTGKKEYANTKQEDSFLLALAEGGFQVEELARMHFPNGVLLEGNDGDYEMLWEQTKELLKNENIIIYEPAFLFDGLFIRADILIKKGNKVELIEVKSKSFDPKDQFIFVGKSGILLSTWKPYLFDIAFQKYVIQLCFEDWNIDSYIMMADKTKTTNINGLNQMFRISKEKNNRTGIIKTIDSIEETGTSILGRIKINDIIAKIINGEFSYSDKLDFHGAINLFKENYINDVYINWPTSFSSCKACEYKTSNNDDGLKSGYRECFIHHHKWESSDFDKPNIFDIWNFRRGANLFSSGIYFKDQLTEDNMGLVVESGKFSTSERQWLQIEKEVTSDSTYHFLKDEMREEMNQWTYPLHFIDFETSAVALPFTKGMRPYEQVAFQFSHHIYYEDRTIEHKGEFIDSKAGNFPNFEFLRALKKSLSDDNGTIFKYSSHENTILNAIYDQLIISSEDDKNELIDFLKDISHSKTDRVEKWKGTRDMFDLLEMVKKYYYNPLMKGSNSIKYVLPAVLNSSAFLKDKYSKSLKESQITSKNFPEAHVWLKMENDIVTNPYKMLPQLFQEWSVEELDEVFSGLEEIADGGAALTAYGKLQYTNLSENERDEITKALLKYCELDTLAMVMIFEHFKEITE